MTIGERIKALRKKNGLTQEKLAENLGVSYQAVSKWECNVSIPDITLIAPITKIFNVTADELLGIKESGEDKLKSKFDTAYEQYRNSPNYSSSYWWAKEAVLEFPNDHKYLEWLAYSEYRLAFEENISDSPSIEYFEELTENSLRHFESVIENSSDPSVYLTAVLGKIILLRFLERTEEADWSAEFEYPDINIKTAKDALMLCDDGKILLKYLENEIL